MWLRYDYDEGKSEKDSRERVSYKNLRSVVAFHLIRTILLLKNSNH